MATISAADLTALAETFAAAMAEVEKTAAGMERHIEHRAQQIAAERSKIYAKAADERIKAVTDEAAAQIRQRDDMIAELRLQLEVRTR